MSDFRRPRAAESGSESDDERVARLEERLRAVERRLDLALTELERVHATRAWRLSNRARRAASALRLGARRLCHPIEWLRVLLPRYLPARTRAKLLRAFRRVASAPAPEPTIAAVEGAARGRATRRPALVILPVIDWEFRWQRPQQLAVRLAARGWPVLYARLALEAGAGSARLDGEPLAEGVWGLRFSGSRVVDPYREELRPADARRLASALAGLQRELRLDEVVVFVELPFWGPLAALLRHELGWPVIYDLMDDHAAFAGTGSAPLKAEQELLAAADAVLPTSAALEEKARRWNACVRRVPNGCDWEHWSKVVERRLPDAVPRPVVGYYGAISEWFDGDLVVELAVARPDWSFVLIGSTYGGPAERLASLPNAHLLGERPYQELPDLVAGFDVCMIPFRVTRLTRATDPVKVYEMLAAGKEVVATRLPELEALGDLIHLADGTEAFMRALELAVYRGGDPLAVERRQAFAFANRWEDRVDRVEAALRDVYPPVSIAIVTYNRLDLTRLCLESLFSQTAYPNFEVVVVDNGSTDGTADALAAEAEENRRLRVLRNDSNRGFAAACNQAFRAASGEYLVFLNNDTVVSAGWLSAMVRALRHNPGWGLVGGVTNAIGNEARIPVGYGDLAEMPAWASEYVWEHRGESFELPMVAFFCATMRRDVWERVGELDERFGLGMFEDDDYCRRVRRAGFEIRCLRDCFVHHWQMASFRALDDATYQELYERNRRALIEKWRSGG